MLRRIFGRLILALGIALLLFQLVYHAREFSAFAGWQRSGGLRSEVLSPREAGAWVVAEADPADFPLPPRPARGDTLLTVRRAGGEPVPFGEWLALEVAPAGERLVVEFRHAGEVLETEALNQPRSVGRRLFLGSYQMLRFLIGVGYLLVGLWALLRRPHSGGVRALALFCFAMATFMVVSVRLGLDKFATFALPGLPGMLHGLSYFDIAFGAFWLNLQLYFPRPLTWARRHPLPVHLLIYAPQILIVLASTLLPPAAQRNVTAFAMIAISLQVAGGFILLGWRRARASNFLERRQLSLVFYGSGLGLTALFLIVVLHLIPGFWLALPEALQLILPLLTFLALLISPVSFAYAFGRYRLLEVEGRLRRGTRYVLVTAGLLLVFFLVILGVSELMLSALSIRSRTPTLFVALVFAIAFTPVQRRVQALVEGRFYPERRRLRELLRDFQAAMGALPDRRALWMRLRETLVEGLGIREVTAVLWDETTGRFSLPDGSPAPFEQGAGLIAALQGERRPLPLDEVAASERVFLDTVEVAWALEREVDLFLPVAARDRLVGFLALSFEEGRLDVGAESLVMLGSLAGQAALESENLRLLEETYDKRRLEEQLAMARRVQENFLPATLPPTPGLEVATRFVPSLEVAGDYYDVLALPDGRTLLAVGDVSGKGAGAAMIMANLQASLRSMARLDAPLAEMVSGINDIIHQNTRPEQFVTFFAAVYDPAVRRLRYVNAGHNVPRLLSPDGTCRQLDVGGPLLGVFPGKRYEEGALDLAPGELLLAFTDGVSEAANEADEEFGEESVVDVLDRDRARSLERLLADVERAVSSFCGARSLRDDFTLLLARVRPPAEREG